MENNDQHHGSLRLPSFWPENTKAWFAVSKTRFRLRQIDDEQQMFDLVVNALPKESLRMVLDLITDPPEDLPYTEIKERLSSSHQLTDFQRVEKLHNMDSLGGRKPSDLLHEMIEVCLTGHETSPFFVFLYLQCLPRELRIMLGEDNVDDLRAIGLKAEKLWSIHNHQQHGEVVSLSSSSEPPAATVAAVKQSFPAKQCGGSNGSGRGKGRGKGASHSGADHSSSLNPSAAVYSPPPSSLAR
jgi:hypothetical protein